MKTPLQALGYTKELLEDPIILLSALKLQKTADRAALICAGAPFTVRQKIFNATFRGQRIRHKIESTEKYIEEIERIVHEFNK